MSILNFKIDRIVTEKFKLKEIDSMEDLRFSLSFQFKLSISESVICCVSEFEYRSNDEPVMEISLDCYFRIVDNELDSMIEDNRVIIDAENLQYLATIAVGIARGEIHARCEVANSPLQEVVLPQVNLTKIITTPSDFLIDS